MKILLIRIISPLLVIGSLISGCAQQPDVAPTEDPAQLTQLAAQILAKAVYTNTIFNECTPLGEEAELEAISVQQDWINKNWAAIIAADHYYTRQLGSQAAHYNGQNISLSAVLLAYQ